MFGDATYEGIGVVDLGGGRILKRPKLMKNSDPSEAKVVTCPVRPWGGNFIVLTVKSSILGVSEDKSGIHIFDQKEPPSRVGLKTTFGSPL